jgi:hypothetical protein
MEMHDMEQQVLQLKRRLQPPPPPQQQQHAAAAELQDQATAAAAAAAAAEGGNYMPGHQQQHQQQRQAAVLHSSTTMGLRDNRSLVPLGLSLLIQFDVTTSKVRGARVCRVTRFLQAAAAFHHRHVPRRCVCVCA